MPPLALGRERREPELATMSVGGEHVRRFLVMGQIETSESAGTWPLCTQTRRFPVAGDQETSESAGIRGTCTQTRRFPVAGDQETSESAGIRQLRTQTRRFRCLLASARVSMNGPTDKRAPPQRRWRAGAAFSPGASATLALVRGCPRVIAAALAHRRSRQGTPRVPRPPRGATVALTSAGAAHNQRNIGGAPHQRRMSL